MPPMCMSSSQLREDSGDFITPFKDAAIEFEDVLPEPLECSIKDSRRDTNSVRGVRLVVESKYFSFPCLPVLNDFYHHSAGVATASVKTSGARAANSGPSLTGIAIVAERFSCS